MCVCARKQVATYRYDIKRVNDQEGEGGLLVRSMHACLSMATCGLRRTPLQLARARGGAAASVARLAGVHVHAQVHDACGADSAASSAASSSGVHAYKVFLVQVRETRRRRPCCRCHACATASCARRRLPALAQRLWRGRYPP